VNVSALGGYGAARDEALVEVEVGLDTDAATRARRTT